MWLVFCINYFAAWPGKMSDSEFFDGADNGDGLPMRYTIPADEVKDISQLQKMVTIEIDRSRSRSNHLNKMMRNLIEKQKDVRKHTMESYNMLSEEIEKQEQRYSSLKTSPTGSDETTPPDPTTISDGLADPADSAQPLVRYRQNDTGDENPAPPPPPRDSPPLYDFESSDEDSEQQPADLQPVIVSSSNPDQTDVPKIVPDTRDRVAGALRARGIPEDLKVNFEFHPIHGPRLLVTRQTRLEGKAEQRVQDNMFKLAAGFAQVLGFPKALPYTETFTGDARAKTKKSGRKSKRRTKKKK